MDGIPFIHIGTNSKSQTMIVLEPSGDYLTLRIYKKLPYTKELFEEGIEETNMEFERALKAKLKEFGKANRVGFTKTDTLFDSSLESGNVWMTYKTIMLVE